jgi:CRISPR system Cascade subunit CasB
MSNRPLTTSSPPEASEAFSVIQGLEQQAASDTAVLAVLRRSASYNPGLYPPAFPYVEPLIYGHGEWRRQATYLAAACWAKSRRQRDGDDLERGQSLPTALRTLHQDPTNPQARNLHASKNIEKRFTALLDADADELPWRLRQITAVLDAAAIAIDWPSLLADLWRWNHPDRHVQIRWARQFWAPTKRAEKESEPQTATT